MLLSDYPTRTGNVLYGTYWQGIVAWSFWANGHSKISAHTTLISVEKGKVF
jgi:hypothetical protein